MGEPVIADGVYYSKQWDRHGPFDGTWSVRRKTIDGGEEYQEDIAHLDTEGLADILMQRLTQEGGEWDRDDWYAAR